MAVTIQTFTIPDWSHGGGGMPPRARFFPVNDFLSTDGKFIKAGSISENKNFFEFSCAVSGNVLTVPDAALPIPAAARPRARYTLVIFSGSGRQKIETIFEDWELPETYGPEISFAQLLDWRLSAYPVLPRNIQEEILDVIHKLGLDEGAVLTVNGRAGFVTLTTNEIPEGSSNKYFTFARVLGVVLASLSLINSEITGEDTILSALGKLQAQITNYASRIATFSNKTISGASNTITNLPTSSLNDKAVTLAKMQDVSESRLLGRGAGSGAGTAQEVGLGSGFFMTGTTLNFIGEASSVGLPFLDKNGVRSDIPITEDYEIPFINNLGNHADIPLDAAPQVRELADLSDVSDTASPTAGHYLRADGASFTDSAIAAADVPAGIDAAKIADGSISNAEFQTLNNAASNIQTQLDGKSPASHNHAGTYEPANANIQSHIASTANPHAVTKAQVGLSNVPNTDATARSNHTGTQTAATISDFSTAALTAAPAETTTTTGTMIHGATGKTTPVDADEIGVGDSAASFILKKLSLTNLKAFLKTYFDTLYPAIGTVGTGDVTGAASSVDSEIPLFSGTTGKALKRMTGSGIVKVSSGVATAVSAIAESEVTNLTTDLAAKEATANKDASGGYSGLTLFKINFKNAANTFTSFFTNANTAARTYTFADRNGTIADDTDITAAKARSNHTGSQTASTISDFANAALYTVLTGYSVGSNIALAATDGILLAFTKVQGQINAINNALATKLVSSNNLSDLTNAGNARTNLGLGALATLSSIGTAQLASDVVTPAKLAETYIVNATTSGINSSTFTLAGPIPAGQLLAQIDRDTTINATGPNEYYQKFLLILRNYSGSSVAVNLYSDGFRFLPDDPTSITIPGGHITYVALCWNPEPGGGGGRWDVLSMKAGGSAT